MTPGNFIILFSTLIFFGICFFGCSDNIDEIDLPYKPSWNSLGRHATPEWFKDAKFGIYTHWGGYSVPAKGPNGSWYPHNMYREGNPQFDYHARTYGPASEFGYKDFIPLFTAEKFDANFITDMALDAGMVQSLLEFREELLVCPDLLRLDAAVKAERRKPTHHLADVPLDRMEPVAAVGDVGGADVLCGR